MSSLVAFIIGSGANVGLALATKLKTNGYRVALGSRNPDVEKVKNDGFFPVVVDGTKPESINEAFATVNEELGAPNVVIYNVGAAYPPPTPTDPLSLPQDKFFEAIHIGAGAFIAAQAALKGFRSEVHKNNPKAFITTGNILHVLPPVNPAVFALAQQKVLESYYMNLLSKAYAQEGIRFHYALLVGADGKSFPDFAGFRSSGPVHAEVYWDLITRKEAENWDHRFTLPDGKKPEY